MTAVASNEQTRDSLTDLDARVLAESLPHMVWVKGPDGATVYLNGKGIEFFGVGVEDMYGWSWLSLVHADDVDVVHSAWDKAVRGGSDYVSHIRMRRADGVYRWIASRGSAIHGPDASVVRWVGTFTDIDDYKRLEVSLARSERDSTEALTVLDTLQATAPVGFVFVDCDFRYIRVNEKAAEISGLPVADHLGRTVAEVVPDLWPLIEPAYRGVLEHRRAGLERGTDRGDRGGTRPDQDVARQPLPRTNRGGHHRDRCCHRRYHRPQGGGAGPDAR